MSDDESNEDGDYHLYHCLKDFVVVLELDFLLLLKENQNYLKLHKISKDLFHINKFDYDKFHDLQYLDDQSFYRIFYQDNLDDLLDPPSDLALNLEMIDLTK